MVSHWESEEAHQEWTRSEAFRQAHAGVRADFIAGPPEFKKYDVRIASDPDGPKGQV